MTLEPASRPALVTGARMLARLSRQLEVALTEVDLTPSQYRMLMLLSNGSSAASALADRLAVTKPSITALVDGMVARGLVDRSSDPDDRRRVTHQVTQSGRDVLDAADGAVAERLAELTSEGPDEAARAALAGLEAWQAVMQRLIEVRSTAATRAAQ